MLKSENVPVKKNQRNVNSIIGMYIIGYGAEWESGFSM